MFMHNNIVHKLMNIIFKKFGFAIYKKNIFEIDSNLLNFSIIIDF